MKDFKVKSAEESKYFIKTKSFLQLLQTFESLKHTRGRAIHVIGAPGTGKSANIYHALDDLDLNVYDSFLFLEGVQMSSQEVFKTFFNTLRDDMGVTNKEQVYDKAAEYDAVFFADRFLDSEFLDENKIGLSKWTEENGARSFPFYLRCLIEYLTHHKQLKKVNIVTQTAWTIKYDKVRYDLFTDFSYLSSILVFFLKILFEVVEISYSKEETIKIVNIYFPNLKEDIIRDYIRKYGTRPRFILKAIEKYEDSG